MFKNVNVVKKANVYFDGNVTSRTVIFEDGTKKTLGIIMPGKYEFGTEDKEVMEVLSGAIEALLPGSDTYVAYKEGQSFEVSADSVFKIAVSQITDYCCSYIKE